MADIIEEVTVVKPNGQLHTLNSEDLRFGYRVSNLSKYIIISVKLHLKPKNKSKINRTIKEFIKYRNSTQRLKAANAGCVFKNPSNNRLTAARLIDLCGLKGKQIKGACVSEKHANFIVNQKNARAEDVLRLMKIIQNRVEDKFKVYLEPEIKIIG